MERMNEGKTYGRSKDGIEERERRMQEEKRSNKRRHIRMSK